MKLITVLTLFFTSLAAAFSQQPADFKTAGFWARLGIGVPVPIGLSSQVLTVGIGAAPAAGYHFSLGPGRMIVGLETGILLEFTQDLPTIDQYVSCQVPLAVLAEYDLPLAGIFHAYGGVQAGLGVTFVDYTLPSIPGLTTMKFLLGLELGAGLDLGIFTFQAGARFIAVFYDVNAYLAIVPGVRAVIRFPAAVKSGTAKTDAPKKADMAR